MKRARWIPVLVVGGLLSSCGEGLAPPTTGSIALLIQFAQPQGPALSVTGDGGALPSFDAAS
ncbi:MAG: hypothetical protein OEV95_14170, partial [Gemmatimonadota bacterium]|nr:hypothetical protein [Gemmatimonadota bacterium]